MAGSRMVISLHQQRSYCPSDSTLKGLELPTPPTIHRFIDSSARRTSCHGNPSISTHVSSSMYIHPPPPPVLISNEIKICPTVHDPSRLPSLSFHFTTCGMRRPIHTCHDGERECTTEA